MSMLAKEQPIVLVGPMGVGKTTIGKKLSKALGLPFADSDQLIVEKYGPIPKIFEELGERKFRELEEEIVLQQLASPKVLATGGGAVLSSKVREALPVAFVVYLSTDGRHMSSRLASGKRPLLKNGIADWRTIYEARRHLYEEVADYTLDTSRSGLKENVEAIVERISQND